MRLIHQADTGGDASLCPERLRHTGTQAKANTVQFVAATSSRTGV